MQTLAIIIPIPHRMTHPNSRAHWAAKAKRTKDQREDAKLAAMYALRSEGRNWKPPKAAKTQAVFYFRTKHSRDVDGLTAWLKASYDGLADAGVVENDKFFVGHGAEVAHDPKDPHVLITITPIP